MRDYYFSVVISAYNASDFIAETLDSVRRQSYKNFEVVLVDDGSPISMEVAIDNYKKQYPDFPLRYVWQKNTGPAGARKKSVEEAKYEFVAMLDHDDFWYEDKLKEMNKAINETEADIYYHDENECDENGAKHLIQYRQLEEDALTDLIINGNTISTSATVIKRDFFLKSNPYSDNKRYGEDYECWIRLAKSGGRFKHVDKVLGEYRRLNSSLTLVNVNYTKLSNEAIVDFYDYLDRECFSDAEIEKLKEQRRIFNEYLLGRFYHNNKDYRLARDYYKKSIRMGNKSWKCIVAFILSILRVKC